MSRYRELDQDAALATWVDAAWTIEPGEPVEQHRVLPDGCIDVLWSDTLGVTVVGPMTRAVVAPLGPGSRVAGIRFLPGAAPALLGVRPEALLDERVATGELLGDDGKRLEEDVVATASPLDALRRFVIARAARAPRPDPLVRAAVERVATGRPLADLAVSERQLRRRVTAEVGYGPKRLARILRLRRALAVAPGDGLASAALDAGYSDQSHFTNDCVELAGVPPGRLLFLASAA